MSLPAGRDPESSNPYAQQAEWSRAGAGGRAVVPERGRVPDEEGSGGGRRWPGTAGVRGTSGYTLRNRHDGTLTLCVSYHNEKSGGIFKN